MKNTIITGSLTLLGLFFCLNLFAQDDDADDSKGDFIRTEKIGFFTKNLNLSSQQAQLFWPVYDEFEMKQRNINRELRQISKKLQGSTHSTKDINAIESRFLELKKQQDALFFTYHDKFKAILGTEKTLKLYQAEVLFKSYLLQQYREQQQKGIRR